MGAPKIKIYQLPEGYTEAADNDIQSRAGDELIPVVPKLGLLTQVKALAPLTPVIPVTKGDLFCFDLAGGRVTRTLTTNPAKPGYSIPDAGAWASYLWQPVGALAPVVKKADGVVVDPHAYVVDENGITFTTNVVGVTVELYQRATVASSKKFAFAGDTFYRGANFMWNRLLVSVDGGEYRVVTPPADRQGYIDAAGVTALAGVTTSLKATYAVERVLNDGTSKTPLPATFFLDEHPNWVGGHIRMWPDVFVGEYDYPGDQYTDTNTNTPVDPHEMPRFREPGTYTLFFREGMVQFAETIDATAAENAPGVRVNASYVAGVTNVTNQKLDAVAATGNRKFRADAEAVYPASHGKRWVGRKDDYMPLNVYVDGVIAPQPKQVLPETLAVKTGP